MLCDVLSIAGLLLSLYVLYKILDRLVRVPRIGRYGDHYVLVTGCANGFGYEAVKRLDRLGCHVFAACRREESVGELQEIFSDRIHPFRMDVTNHDSVHKGFDYVSSNLPKNTGLWGLVNNAGVYHMLPIELVSIPMYQRMLATNLLGVIDVTMTFLPLVKKARGRVVNVSSDSGRNTVPLCVSYCMSKYGLEAFTDGLRRSIGRFGCRALLIEPGAYTTHIFNENDFRKDFNSAWESASAQTKSDLGEKFRRTADDKIWKLIKEFPVSEKLSEVIDTYEHALFGVFPRARYVVGRDAKFFLFLQLLPECLSDRILNSLLPSLYNN